MTMETPDPLPSLGVVSTALRTTTELLVHELARPGESVPLWNEFEWDVARAAAAMQGISMLLARRLRWQGPERWERFLEEQRLQSHLRERRVGETLAEIDAGAKREGISVVGLKGSALRALGLYEPGDRPMADIDLLARPEDTEAVTRIIASMGYRESVVTERNVAFSREQTPASVRIGEHIENPLKIELHTHVGDALPFEVVDITSRLAPRDAAPGITGYASHAALLAHLAMHAAGNMRAHALRAIQIHDIALLAPLLDEQEWSELADSWWAFPALSLAQRYFAAPVPPALLRQLKRLCPPLLAMAAARYDMTGVTWANLHISAFPGIEWSRSVGDAWRYAYSRIAPGKQARAVIKVAVSNEPFSKDTPWYQISHRRRILRWLSGRAPRVQTLWTVQRALARDSG